MGDDACCGSQPESSLVMAKGCLGTSLLYIQELDLTGFLSQRVPVAAGDVSIKRPKEPTGPRSWSSLGLLAIPVVFTCVVFGCFPRSPFADALVGCTSGTRVSE